MVQRTAEPSQRPEFGRQDIVSQRIIPGALLPHRVAACCESDLDPQAQSATSLRYARLAPAAVD